MQLKEDPEYSESNSILGGLETIGAGEATKGQDGLEGLSGVEASEKMAETDAARILNEDDRADYVMLMQSPYFCGTGGCNLLIVDGRKHQVVFDFTGCSKPVCFITLGNGQVILKYNRQGGGLPQSWQYYALSFT